MPLDGAADVLIPPKATLPVRPVRGWGLIKAMRANMLSLWGPRAYEERIIHTRLFGRDRILVNDPAAIRRVLIENPFGYEKPAPTRRLTRPIVGEGLLLSEGQEWRRQRRTLSPAFTPQHVDAIAGHFSEAAKGLIDGLAGQDRVQLMRPVQQATLDAAARSLFSMPIGGRGTALRALVRDYVTGPGRPTWLDLLARREDDFAWLTPGRQRFRRRWLKAVDAVVAARRAQARPEDALPDVLDLLLDARDPETGSALSDAEIRDQTATMLAAGFETTAQAVFWTLYLLSRDLGEQDRIRAEILADPPSTSVAGTARRWPRLRRAILEAMRLYPPAPMLFRLAVQPDRLLHVDVARGAIVIISPWIVHRHKTLWDRPDAFRPDRFEGKEREYLAGGAYLPFGAGPRICIGASLALTEASILLAMTLERFELALDDPRELVPLSLITTRPSIDPWFSLRPVDKAAA